MITIRTLLYPERECQIPGFARVVGRFMRDAWILYIQKEVYG